MPERPDEKKQLDYPAATVADFLTAVLTADHRTLFYCPVPVAGGCSGVVSMGGLDPCRQEQVVSFPHHPAMAAGFRCHRSPPGRGR